MSRLKIILLNIIFLIIGSGVIAVKILYFSSIPHPQAKITDVTPYHLIATRQRGSVLFNLETWYKDDTHQRTDAQVTLPTGEKITIGTVINGKEYWAYRIEPQTPAMTRAIHITETTIHTPNRLLFTYGKINTLVSQYKQQGCSVRQKQNQLIVAKRETRMIIITPQSMCTGQEFDIPNSALIYNNINFYQAPVKNISKSSENIVGPMTVWVDTESSVVLQAQRTTQDNKPWDIYKVLSLTYNPHFPNEIFIYTPPSGMTVLTNPATGIE